MGNNIGSNRQPVVKLTPNNIGNFWMNFCASIRDPFMAMTLWQVGPMPWLFGNGFNNPNISIWNNSQFNSTGQNWGISDSFTPTITSSPATTTTTEAPKTQEEKDLEAAKKKQLEIKFNKLKDIMNEYKNTLDESVLEEGALLQKINRITAKSVTQESYDELLQVFKDNKDAILEHEQKIVQKDVTSTKNESYERTVNKLKEAINKDGKYDIDDLDVMELITTWNSTNSNRSYIMTMLYNKTCGKTPEQQKEWRKLAKDFHEKLLESAEDIKQSELSNSTKNNLQDAIESFNKFNSNTGLTRNNISNYQKAFDKLYKQIRLAEAEIADKTLKEKFDFLEEDNPYQTEDFMKDAQEDLKNEKV